jgi:hypothetical protein
MLSSARQSRVGPLTSTDGIIPRFCKPLRIGCASSLRLANPLIVDYAKDRRADEVRLGALCRFAHFGGDFRLYAFSHRPLTLIQRFHEWIHTSRRLRGTPCARCCFSVSLCHRLFDHCAHPSAQLTIKLRIFEKAAHELAFMTSGAGTWRPTRSRSASSWRSLNAPFDRGSKVCSR